MKKGLFNKKIPTLLGIILLLAVLGTGFFLWQKNKNKTAAGPQTVPRQIYITNVTDSQFTVSWITQEKTVGYLNYGANPSVKIKSLDDRDQLSGQETPSLVHYVTIKELEKGSSYYFKIGSNNNLYDNNGQPYKVNLGPALGSAGEAKIVSGKILNQNNTAAPGVIVYLTAPNTAPLSSLTDKEGRWAVFLNKARTQDLSSYVIFDPEATVLKIEALNGQTTVSAVTNTKNSFPVPDMILGHEAYDFKTKTTVSDISPNQTLPLQTSPSPNKLVQNLVSPKPSPSLPSESTELEIEDNTDQTPAQFLADPQASASPSAALNTVTITNPSQEGEQINTTMPEITGTGPANTVLTIQIHSPAANTGTVTVASDGSWSFTPSENLTPGEHTLQVSYTDNNGSTKTISRNFVVLAASSTDSPTITSTPSAAQVSPSPQPTPRVTIPSTGSGVPTTGTVAPTFILFLSGLLLTIIGTISIAVDKHKKKLS
jgi:hypothetical protein